MISDNNDKDGCREAEISDNNDKDGCREAEISDNNDKDGCREAEISDNNDKDGCREAEISDNNDNIDKGALLIPLETLGNLTIFYLKLILTVESIKSYLVMIGSILMDILIR